MMHLRIAKFTVQVAVALVCTVAAGAVVLAQESTITTGVVVGTESNDSGEMTAVRVVTAAGETVRFEVTADTSFGLENAAGDRWVASGGATDLVEALRRVADQQRRQQQVTVDSTGGVANSIVQASPASLSSNLGYLFAAFAFGWIALLAYVLYLGQRHRALSQELASMNQGMGAADHDE